MSDIRRRRAVDRTIAGELADAADRAVEVGIGRRTGVAAALADRGLSVTAVDRVDRPTPNGVRFVRDDLVDPDPTVYRGADLVYGLNLPPELHRPAAAVARRVDAGLAFTTLGGDPPAVDARPETLSTPDGTATLYRARDA